MKTEEKAKEYLNSQLTKVDKETVNGLTLYYFQAATVDGYIKGYEDGYQSGLDEFALAEIQAFQKGLAQKDAEWQEKTRWIPVDEMLPENVIEIKQIGKNYLITDKVQVKCYYNFEFKNNKGEIDFAHRGKFYYNGKDEWQWIIGNKIIVTHWREIIE